MKVHIHSRSSYGYATSSVIDASNAVIHQESGRTSERAQVRARAIRWAKANGHEVITKRAARELADTDRWPEHKPDWEPAA